MSTPENITMEYIQKKNKEYGDGFFDRDVTAAYKRRFYKPVYQGPGGVYFVTSEQLDLLPRLYSVFKFDPHTGDVFSWSDFNCFGSLKAARSRAKAVASGSEPL